MDLLAGGRQVSRDPFPLEGPEYKAFVLSSGSHSSPRQRTKCPPPTAPDARSCAEPGPQEICASRTAEISGTEALGVWALGGKAALEGWGRPALQGSLNLGAFRGSQPKTLQPQDSSQPAESIRVIIPSLDF